MLNGEPFVQYNLRALYPFAHQLIVIEGAAPAALELATPDGHSTDRTLETLKIFQQQHDPERKVMVVTAEDEGHPNGFWPGEKDEQSRAYAKRATGDYLWQVDIDEYYRPEDIKYIQNLLRSRPEITAVSFKMVTFWGGFDYLVDSWHLQQGADTYRRLFKWGPGYQYVSHRPPTVVDPQQRDLFELRPLHGSKLKEEGILLYHYSLVFPKQVLEKTNYYSRAAWAQHARQAESWAQTSYLKLQHPFRVHNVYQSISWLERFKGQHPPEILRLRQDLATKRVNTDLRPTGDIERLLNSPLYKGGRLVVKQVERVRRYLRPVKAKIKAAVQRVINNG